MRRKSSFLVAAVLVTSAAFVPAAARADATDVKLTATLDRLAPDRVVVLTLTAKSAGGVTDVTASLHYPSTSGAAYDTVRFTRVAGTDQDGTWQAAYHTDIARHPRANYVNALVTTADGATASTWAKFNDCYETSITDLVAEPSVIDADHSDVTVHGRLMVQKSREAAPEPVPDAEIIGDGGALGTQAGPDGSFTFTSRGRFPVTASYGADGPNCAAGQVTGVTVAKQATELSARMTTAQPVATGTDVAVQGRLLRHGAAGLVPAPGVQLTAVIGAGATAENIPLGPTAADGTFTSHFAADRPGPLTVVASSDPFLEDARTAAGMLDVRRPTVITDMKLTPNPGRYGQPLSISGRLGALPGALAIGSAPLVAEFSANGKTGWAAAGSGKTASNGLFRLTTGAAKRDGYWRVRYAGDSAYMALTGKPVDVDVRYGTSIAGFNASPEPVAKGKTLTVKGQLFRYMDKKLPGPGASVYLYFQAKGSSTWTQMAVVKTASSGWFGKTFKASKDGTWMAAYKGSSTYLASNKPTDYVDVR
ncbi:hypothetical protein GCM10009527_075140 [Actinomadura nitritigenes]|uniref:Htaa domain-containing protein n=1 Tax=Actinomadura nitritigenes TaxID=134602 RepID=A0ABS3R2G9_9ACTN|nr:hypothetical protein [Actinomadura nitritigenes]MBO2440445.1 hypothetical protein [Actinomadura nitritigenes]